MTNLPAAAACAASTPSDTGDHAGSLRIVSTMSLASPVSVTANRLATARANPLQSFACASKQASHASLTGSGIPSSYNQNSAIAGPDGRQDPVRGILGKGAALGAIGKVLLPKFLHIGFRVAGFRIFIDHSCICHNPLLPRCGGDRA
jgi:hypothetical protein